MKSYSYNKLGGSEILELTKRPSINFENIFQTVKPILNDIKTTGIEAALKYAKEFDGFSGKNILVSEEEIESAGKNISDKIKSAINIAADNITKFHSHQKPSSYEVETMKGIKCSREFRAIENIGLYIPGGNAVLPSTMLMLGIPAKIAGCKRVVVCSPSKNEKINDVLLYSVKLCGIKEFYKIGGAQAVGLMAYGGEGIQKVDKIFGPGNQYVTAAKMLVSIDPDAGCAIDMPAGPSEVLIIADENADPSFVASDLLAQAEHGADSQVILISTSEEIIKKVNYEIEVQLRNLPRKKYAEKALENSFSIFADNLDQAINFSNLYAPEHLILNIKNAYTFKEKIQNAGSVFLGQYSPESAGDYATGTNHSLPTSGYAKVYSGVTVESFMKSVSFQQLDKNGLKNISDTVETLAEAEGLHAHKNSISIRMNK